MFQGGEDPKEQVSYKQQTTQEQDLKRKEESDDSNADGK